jgi:hypothetical protein
VTLRNAQGAQRLTIGTCRLEHIRTVSGQGHTFTPENWDAMIPHFVQNVSENGRAILHRITHPSQPMNPSFSTAASEMEALTVRLLAPFTTSPSWENSVSFVNEHHQTLAHLAVLFRYTTLLDKVAQWGINVDVQDVNGFTALHCAYLCGDLDSVRILKGYGADEDVQDCLGRRPLDMYIPREKTSPSGDRTSSSARIPSAIGDDWEELSAASSSFSHNENIPASRGQQLHASESTTSSRIVPASIPMPSPTYHTSAFTEEALLERFSGFKLHDSPKEMEQSPLSPHFPNVSAVQPHCPPAVAHQGMTARPQECGQLYSSTPSSNPTPRLSVSEARAQPSRAPEATSGQGAVHSKVHSDGGLSISPPPLDASVYMPVPSPFQHDVPPLQSSSLLDLQTAHSGYSTASCHPTNPCPEKEAEPEAKLKAELDSQPETRPPSAGRPTTATRFVPPSDPPPVVSGSGLTSVRSSVYSDTELPLYEKGKEKFSDDKSQSSSDEIDRPEESRGGPVKIMDPAKLKLELENCGDPKRRAVEVHEGNLFYNLRPEIPDSV